MLGIEGTVELLLYISNEFKQTRWLNALVRPLVSDSLLLVILAFL